MYLKPLDQDGLSIEVGDWVRLVEIPPAITTMPRETRSIFRRALGLTFKVESFNQYGYAELDLSKKVGGQHTIWVEPVCLRRFRRKTRSQKS